MAQRLDVEAVAPEAVKAVLGVEAYSRGCGLEPGRIHLVKMRASQFDGCAICLDMHSHDAHQRGETEQRLYLLDAWRDVAFDNPRERAALAWTKAPTWFAKAHAPDDEYAELRGHFSVDLSTLVGLINLLTHLCVSLRAQPPVRRADAA
jgi:AhpD family alkylhydroperoxidase